MNRKTQAPVGPEAGEIRNSVVGANDQAPPAITAAGTATVVRSERRTAQERAKEEERTVKEVLRLVDDIVPEAFGGMKTNRRHVLGARLIRMARAWGMTDPRDMAIFCALYRYSGKAFFERPAWLDAAGRVKNGESTWSKELEDPQIWEEPQQGTRA